MRFWLVLLLALFVVGSLVWISFSGLGDKIASRYTPEGIDVAQWGGYINNLLSLMVILVALVYYLYTTVLQRALRVDRYDRVFALGNPWAWGLLICFLSLLVLGSIVGMTKLPRRSLMLVLATAVPISGLAAAGGSIVYYLLTLLYSPPKIRYAPMGRCAIARGMRAIRGGKS